MSVLEQVILIVGAICATWTITSTTLVVTICMNNKRLSQQEPPLFSASETVDSWCKCPECLERLAEKRRKQFEDIEETGGFDD